MSNVFIHIVWKTRKVLRKRSVSYVAERHVNRYFVTRTCPRVTVPSSILGRGTLCNALFLCIFLIFNELQQYPIFFFPHIFPTTCNFIAGSRM